jgi:hypothetical protein
MAQIDPLFAPVDGSETRTVAGVQLDVVQAGSGRVKRVIYPPGFRWSSHMKPIVGSEYCQHAHVGFLVHGQIHIEYADGCKVEMAAPQAMVIEPGHDGWVVGEEPAVVIEFDFQGETASRFGMPESHRHQDRSLD